MQQYLTHLEKTTTMTSKKVHYGVFLPHRAYPSGVYWSKFETSKKVEQMLNPKSVVKILTNVG
jgi:hypothetical protein